jgi:hypothetical protein
MENRSCPDRAAADGITLIRRYVRNPPADHPPTMSVFPRGTELVKAAVKSGESGSASAEGEAVAVVLDGVV